MGEYVPLVSEFIAFIGYMLILLVLYIILLAWIVDTDKHGELWKWGSVGCAIMGVITIWIMNIRSAGF